MSAPSDGARGDARKRLAESDLFGIDPTFADSEPPTLVIDSGWLCESVNKHTCGAGPGSYGGMHEPGCGLVPIANIADLLAGVIADAKAEAWDEGYERSSDTCPYNAPHHAVNGNPYRDVTS